jgi:hypothetical protein
MIPPPNVTGVLTMGHVLNNTIAGHPDPPRPLEGREALWLPGTDHAGIATQTVVERELRKEKKTRHHLGREEVPEKGLGLARREGRHHPQAAAGARRLGVTGSRTQFTMDPAYSQAVLKVFVDLYGKGHIYRGKRMVNWCPVSLTALSDEEVIMKPVKGTIYQVRYERTDAPGQFIEVKTTRPETIPGDVAIAVHPDDPRYALDWQEGAPSARARRRDPDHRRRGRGQGVRLRRAQDHAGARQGGFRCRPAPQARRRSTCSRPTPSSTSSPARSWRAWTVSPAARRPPSCSRNAATSSRRRPTRTTSAIPSAPTCRSSRA